MQPERSPDPDQALEWLEARLRALPPPAIPANLEDRLLAAMPVWPRRRVVWLSLAGILAASCLLAVLAWQGRHEKKSDPGSGKIASVQPVKPIPQTNVAEGAAWREARRTLNTEETPAFTWPLLETTPFQETRSIPPDLLD